MEGFCGVNTHFMGILVETLHYNVLYLYSVEKRCGLKYDFMGISVETLHCNVLYLYSVEIRCGFKYYFGCGVERRCGATSLRGYV